MQGPLLPAAEPAPSLPGLSADEDIAWLDGSFLPRRSLCLPVGDAGFVLGATVTEQLRTFRGRLFLPIAHEDRMRDSLAVVGIEAGRPLDEVFRAAAAVAARNHAAAASDLGVVVFVTPGDQPSQHGGKAGRPRVAIHTFPLAFATWADAYDTGVALRSVSVRQVPAACWPMHAKVRSRLHYFLADREARAAESGSRAVLCHENGRVSETSTANVAVVREGVIGTPPQCDALPGVSMRYLRGLAESLGVGWRERSLTLNDLAAADEILLTSTPNCVVPATRLDGRLVGTGRPGPVHAALLDAWSQSVGLDIAAQARTSGR